eukprot:357329-Chlamydomonas_euryale.AAC.6
MSLPCGSQARWVAVLSEHSFSLCAGAPSVWVHHKTAAFPVQGHLPCPPPACKALKNTCLAGCRVQAMCPSLACEALNDTCLAGCHAHAGCGGLHIQLL